jgi:membrane protease YdiL (CAAX protease family)
MVAYSVGEEAGWRGYLHDALRPQRMPARVAVGGGLWFLWHATFYADLLRPAFAAQFLALILLGTPGG